jgi:NAD(P)-dependent dehydrogenase (short-subunit alcohol dehydrogenase family)
VGGGGGRAIADLKEDAILADLNVKLMGYMRLARAVAPHMIAGGWGRVINIGGHAMRVTGNYSAALRNAAITAWSSNLAGELGPQGINVNTVHPNFTFTERRNDNVGARAMEANNTARVPEATDIAYVVAVLASPRGWVINGESIMASGGLAGVINY